MLDFPRSREPKPLWSSCFLISPALQDKKFVGNLIRVHYQHEKKQCEVHSIFIFSIFFSNCRLKPVKNNSRMPVWQKSTEQLKCDKIWEIFWSHVVNISQKKVSHTWLDDIYFNIRWQIDSSVSFLWFCSSIRIGLRHFETILRHLLEQTEN